MKYFAYGSNMSLARIKQRIPEIEKIGVFKLEHYELKFNKLGKDGSGKCNIVKNDASNVFGVLYEISSSDKKTLDQIEGSGISYTEVEVLVFNELGQMQTAYAYYGIIIDESLKPFKWYQNHVMKGASENDLPLDYINNYIKNISTIDDLDLDRSYRENNIYPSQT